MFHPFVLACTADVWSRRSLCTKTAADSAAALAVSDAAMMVVPLPVVAYYVRPTVACHGCSSSS